MLCPSTPPAPLFRATLRHAASRVVGRMSLSIKLNHLPPVTPLTSADTMRSVQIEASTHHSSRFSPPVVSVPCLALTTLPELCCSIPTLAHPPSCLPSLGPVLLANPRATHGIGTMKALTPAALTQTGRSLRLRRLEIG